MSEEEEQEQVNPEKILGVYTGERNNQDGMIFYFLKVIYLCLTLFCNLYLFSIFYSVRTSWNGRKSFS